MDKCSFVSFRACGLTSYRGNTLIGNLALQYLELVVSPASLIGGRYSMLDIEIQESAKSTWDADFQTNLIFPQNDHPFISLLCSRAMSNSCAQANGPKAY